LALTRTDGSAGALDAHERRDGGRRGLSRRAGNLPTLGWLLVLTLAAAYVIVFVLGLSDNLARLAWNPSVSSAFTMSETLVKTGSGGATAMGSTPQWVSLWFGLLTATLPLHRELWEISPTLLFVATAAIVGWSVSRLAGRDAGVLALLLGVVASPLALTFFMAPFSHNTVYPCTALLGAYLLWLARAEHRRALTALAVPPLAGIVVGVCLSSDFLLAATAVIPLTLAALLAGVRRHRGSRLLALSALVTVAVAIPIAKLTSATMRSLGYLTLPTPVKTAALSELPARARLLFKGLQELFNGYLGFEKPGTLNMSLGIACDVVMSVALVALLVIGARAGARLAISGLRRSSAQTDMRQLERSLHIVYWVTATIVPAAAFWVAGEGPVTTHESYYATAIFAVAAVLPLQLANGRAARLLILGGASILFTASLVGLSDGYINISAKLGRSVAMVTRIARADDAQVGYANWADASPLTWSTDNRVIVRPVVECASAEGTGLCPGFQAYVPAWYAPRARRTFLLVEANGVDLNSVPADLGRPLAVYAFESMRMYVYPYDIASRFGPAVN
jgi:hypothetical protein